MERIFGYEVDAATFKKYNHQNYTIGYGFYGLAGVERWATDPDRAARFPDQAAEARQIMEQIIAEITGKEEQKMKDPRTAADFIGALNEIYIEGRKDFDGIYAKVDKARQRMEKALEKSKTGDKMDSMRYEVARADYQNAADACRAEYRNMISSYKYSVAVLRSKFADYLNEKYAADPEQLDSNTMALLNSGICTPDELFTLVQRHQDCPTMVRIIGPYAKKMRENNRRNMSREDSETCAKVIWAANAAKDGTREMKIFDSAVASTMYGFGQNSDDYSHATRMHSHVTGWLEDFKNQIANLPLTPDGDQTGTGDE